MADAAGAVPSDRLGNLRHTGLSSFWFGLNFHWLPISFVLIQSQIGGFVPRELFGSALGVMVSAGSIFAVVVPPVVGEWSDHLQTRWGRRRPILLGATLANLVGLAVMATATSYLQLLGGYLLIQLFANAAGAAYAGIIPDVVPGAEFGRASGYLAAMNILGGIAGVGGTFAMSALGEVRLSYALIAAVLLLTLTPVLVASRGEGRVAIQPRPRQPLLTAVGEFVRPMASGDFGWVIFTRLMVTAAITVVGTFLSPFFKDVVRVGNADQFTSLWLAIVFLFAVPFGFSGGVISDRYGRKRFVYLSGAAQSLVALVFIVLYPTQIPFVMAMGALYGFGYGLYYAVDWALACDTLPDRDRSAKDMGLFHVAQTLPQTVAPAIGGFLLDLFNRQAPNSGYRAVFASAVLFFGLGTVFVSRIKSVR